jgi:hypothetical protein
MQRVIMLVLAVAAIAACGDTYAERNRAVRAPAAPPASSSDPITNSGQSDSPVTGSASNAASGSRATPSR